MAGNSNSGRGRIGDEEKKRRGTFRADESEAALGAAAAAKIITGPWLSKIPEPSIPLNEIGKAKYDEFTKLLFEGNKLTLVTVGDVERYAVMHQQMHGRLSAGKSVSQQLLNAMTSLSMRLKIAEDAPPLGNPNKKGRFEGVGFSNLRTTPFRLRSPRAAGTGEL
jgi:hypothetical protein